MEKPQPSPWVSRRGCPQALTLYLALKFAHLVLRCRDLCSAFYYIFRDRDFFGSATRFVPRKPPPSKRPCE
jgi:hypothetical protein